MSQAETHCCPLVYHYTIPISCPGQKHTAVHWCTTILYQYHVPGRNTLLSTGVPLYYTNIMSRAETHCCPLVYHYTIPISCPRQKHTAVHWCTTILYQYHVPDRNTLLSTSVPLHYTNIMS